MVWFVIKDIFDKRRKKGMKFPDECHKYRMKSTESDYFDKIIYPLEVGDY